MAAGYSTLGVCYATQQEAVDYFFQSQQGAYSITPTAVYRFSFMRNSDGTWNRQLTTTDFNGVTTINFQLLAGSTGKVAPCEFTANGYDYTAAAAMFAFALTWTLTLWFVAKNAGVILHVIRRY